MFYFLIQRYNFFSGSHEVVCFITLPLTRNEQKYVLILTFLKKYELISEVVLVRTL